MPRVTYDPAMAEWMRDNTEECRLTKPQLVPIFADATRVGEVVDAPLLSQRQKDDIEETILEVQARLATVEVVVDELLRP